MPIKFTPPAGPPVPHTDESGKVSTGDYLRLLGGTTARVALPMIGQAIGAVTPIPGAAEALGGLGGGAGEWLAEKYIDPEIVNPGHQVNKGRIGVATGLGAVPGSWIGGSGKIISGLLRGGALGYAGTAGNKIVAEKAPTTQKVVDDLNPFSDSWSKADVLTGPVLGGALGGGMNYIRGGGVANKGPVGPVPPKGPISAADSIMGQRGAAPVVEPNSTGGNTFRVPDGTVVKGGKVTFDPDAAVAYDPAKPSKAAAATTRQSTPTEKSMADFEGRKAGDQAVKGVVPVIKKAAGANKAALANAVADTRPSVHAGTQPTGVGEVVQGETPGGRFAVADPTADEDAVPLVQSARAAGAIGPDTVIASESPEAPSQATQAALAKTGNKRILQTQVAQERSTANKAQGAENAADLQNIRTTEGGTDIPTINEANAKEEAAAAKAEDEAAQQQRIDDALAQEGNKTTPGPVKIVTRGKTDIGEPQTQVTTVGPETAEEGEGEGEGGDVKDPHGESFDNPKAAKKAVKDFGGSARTHNIEMDPKTGKWIVSNKALGRVAKTFDGPTSPVQPPPGGAEPTAPPVTAAPPVATPPAEAPFTVNPDKSVNLAIASGGGPATVPAGLEGVVSGGAPAPIKSTPLGDVDPALPPGSVPTGLEGVVSSGETPKVAGTPGAPPVPGTTKPVPAFVGQPETAPVGTAAQSDLSPLQGGIPDVAPPPPKDEPPAAAPVVAKPPKAPKGPKGGATAQAEATSQGAAVPDFVKVRQAGEAKAAMEGLWQRLMRNEVNIDNLAPDEAQSLLDRLKAAPGKFPKLQAALEAKAVPPSTTPPQAAADFQPDTYRGPDEQGGAVVIASSPKPKAGPEAPAQAARDKIAHETAPPEAQAPTQPKAPIEVPAETPAPKKGAIPVRQVDVNTAGAANTKTLKQRVIDHIEAEIPGAEKTSGVPDPGDLKKTEWDRALATAHNPESGPQGNVKFSIPGDGSFTVRDNPVALRVLAGKIARESQNMWGDVVGKGEPGAQPNPAVEPTQPSFADAHTQNAKLFAQSRGQKGTPAQVAEIAKTYDPIELQDRVRKAGIQPAGSNIPPAKPEAPAAAPVEPTAGRSQAELGDIVHNRLAKAWANYNNQKGTPGQLAKIKGQLSIADLTRMLGERGVTVGPNGEMNIGRPPGPGTPTEVAPPATGETGSPRQGAAPILAKLKEAGERYGAVKEAKAQGDQGFEPARTFAAKEAQSASKAAIAARPTPDEINNSGLDPRSIKVLLDSQKGSINPVLAARIGLGGAGALAGAATDKDHRLRGALIGGALGAALPSVPGVANAATNLANNTNAQEMVDRIPNILKFNYLASKNGLAANMIGAPAGLGGTTAIERMLEGAFGKDPAKIQQGWNLLREMGGIPGDFRSSVNEAENTLANAPMNVGEALPVALAKTRFDKAIARPATWITAQHMALRNAAMRAGYTEPEATEIALGNEPKDSTGNKTLRTFGQSLQNMKATRDAEDHTIKNLVGNTLLPFSRTATNVLSATPTRTPGVGILAKAMGQEISGPQLAAQQTMGTGISLAAYKLGQSMTPDQAKVARKWVRNFGGRYGLVASAAFEMGQASRLGKNQADALGEGFMHGVPMPTTEVPTDIINTVKDLAHGEAKIPRSAIPIVLQPEDKKAPIQNPVGVPRNIIAGRSKFVPK